MYLLIFELLSYLTVVHN